MINDDILNIVVFMYGMVCLYLPVKHGIIFIKDRHGIGFPVALVFFALGVCVVVTLAFSLNTMITGYNAIDIYNSAILRVALFTSAGASSLYFIHWLRKRYNHLRG